MATALAQLEDLIARMGDVSNAVRARAAIDDASAWIHATTNYVWVDGDDLVDDVPSIAFTICCAVAQRVMENPSGVTSESMGPFTQAVSNSSTDVFLKKSERQALRRAAGVAAGAVILESPYPLRPSTEDIYVPWVDADSEQFPMGPFPSTA